MNENSKSCVKQDPNAYSNTYFSMLAVILVSDFFFFNPQRTANKMQLAALHSAVIKSVHQPNHSFLDKKQQQQQQQ